MNEAISIEDQKVPATEVFAKEGPPTEALVKEGYKKTKLGWIPEEWEVVKLESLVSKIVGGGTPSKDKEDFWNGDIYWASVKDLSNFNPNKTQDKITQLGLEKSSAKLIKAGTLITSTRMLVGTAVIFDVDVAINQDLKAIYPKKNLLTSYLYIYFKNSRKQILSLGTGSTVKGIQLSSLKNLKIPLPPLPEQQKIAAILSTWDNAIDKQEQLIAAKQLYKKGLMQLLLTGKKRFDGFSGEWKEINIAKLGQLIGGGTPSTKNNSYWNGDIPWISSSDLKEENLFEINIHKYITKAAIANSATKIIPKNSLLIVSRVGVGKISISHQNICTSQDFTNLVPDSGDLLFLGFKIQKEIQRLISCNQGTSIKGFTVKDFKRLRFKIPLIKEQQKIASILINAEKEIALLQNQLTQLQTQKCGLMQKLLTGAVRFKI